MKVLVIDDTQVHLKSALQTLGDHQVTTCSSHDQASSLLEVEYDEPKREALMTKYKEEGLEWRIAYDKARKESRLPYWDAVLCDLLMPAGKNAQGGVGLQYVGKEMAVGWSLALVAARSGAKYVAVATDTNHHHHPASAMLDSLDGHIFTIDGAKMLLTNHVRFEGIVGTEGVCKECGGTGETSRNDGSKDRCYSCKKGVTFSENGKDWGDILKKLVHGYK